MRKIISSSILSIALAGLVACGAAPTETQVQPTALPVVEAATGVIAEGRVVPAASVGLTFETTGKIAEILVAEGDTVSAGQPLAHLDNRDLNLRVEQAQVSLEQAQADYAKLLEGATPEQVAAAEAEVLRAQGNLQATQGSVTQADLTAARAELESARARLAQLQAGAKNADVESAQAAVDQARANLQSRRDSLAQAKINAELELERAANALRNAQDNYSRIMWENKDLERLPGDIPQSRKDEEAAALRAVADAETAMQQAQLAVEQARQAEITDVQNAEAQVRDAEARLEKVLSPTDADAIAAARANVAAAEATLARLTGGEQQGNVAAAAAGVSNAEARLAELSAPPSEATLAGGLARVRAAEVALKQAQLDLEKTTLTAPIAGTVAELNLNVGEMPVTGTPAIVLADLNNWTIETEDLTELNIVKVREGDPVIVTFDALSGFELPGTVAQIKPIGQNRQGDIVYTVVVTPNSWDERLRWNMTALVVIEG
ncbi:MAG: HlyD family efflux transporter periplasmic adaptor subunit [Oscillochloris sp.]|nr:HlyD family efflux transporter periplasmic adaptor subunit [Oscillochloris sp.]